VDVDKDGHISYEEVARELAESIVATIEERGDGVTVDDKVREIRVLCEKKDAATSAATAATAGGGGESSGDEKNIAPDIIAYLKDTFDAVDVDKNGTLDTTEFWNILVSVLQLTEGDKQILSVPSSFASSLPPSPFLSLSFSSHFSLSSADLWLDWVGQMEWDDNNDGKISWVEALDEFGKIFRSFMNDNRDHWVSTSPLLLPSPSPDPPPPFSSDRSGG
jgi:hypothetical protein